MTIRKKLTTNLVLFLTQSTQVLTAMMMETTTKRRRRKRKRMMAPLMEMMAPLMEMMKLMTIATCLVLFLTQLNNNFDSNYFKQC